jgi:signal transduction histidine kinase/CheY-like chemotaxis protein
MTARCASPSRPATRRAHAIAVLAVAGASVATAVLWPLIRPSATPLFFAAVAVSSWYGGLGPGLLATALAAGVTEVWFIPPFFTFDLGSIVRVVSFVVVALLVASLYSRARRAQTRAEELAEARKALLVKEQAARAEAETASRAKDEFLAMLSHELRTPLNALMGWVWWLRRGDLEPTRAARALETIDRNTKSLAQLIEDLLDMSRITTGKLRLDIRPTPLAPVIDAAIEAVRPAASAKSIALEVRVDPTVGAVQGDPDRLQQILWNLLSNAVKFTPEHGGVMVRLDRIGATARILVQDTGRGIDPALLPYIFERFRQGDGPVRSLQGLGLGLSIVRHLVEVHGGTIRAESAGNGQGATFVVVLPIHGDVPAALAPASTDRVPVDVLNPKVLEALHILVVEDSADDRDWLARTLAAFGARVSTASSVPEAFATIIREAPDVVVSDVRLPGEDGYDLIRRLREQDAASGRRTAAVAITAYARVEDRARALQAGYQMHVPKPVDPTDLATVISNLTGRTMARS